MNTQRGGGWVIVQSALMIAVAIMGVADSRKFGPLPYQFTFACLLFLASATIGIAGVITLGPNRTPYPTPRPDAQLVQHGIYNFIRHPLYTSVILWAVSWGLFWRSGLTLVASLVLALFFDAKARFEERQLKIRFPEYSAYQARVRKFIPGFY